MIGTAAIAHPGLLTAKRRTRSKSESEIHPDLKTKKEKTKVDSARGVLSFTTSERMATPDYSNTVASAAHISSLSWYGMCPPSQRKGMRTVIQDFPLNI